MASLNQVLVFREIFGICGDLELESEQVRLVERGRVEGFRNIVWVQAKENLLAFICDDGGLTVYNTITSSIIFISDKSIKVAKAWFYNENLMIVTKQYQELKVHQLEFTKIATHTKFKSNYNSLNDFSQFNLIKQLDISGILELDVSQELLVVKYLDYFHIINLFAIDFKLSYEGDARYSKGFIITIYEGKITVMNVRNFKVFSFMPNFSMIFHVGIVNYHILAFNEQGYCRYDLHTRLYQVFNRKTIYKCFEIEDSGESIVQYNDQTSSILTPDEVFIPGCENISSVCDNSEYIFLLNITQLFMASKKNYSIQVFILESPQYSIGCSLNNSEVFIIDDSGLSIWQI